MKKLSPAARHLGEQWGGSYWYEEDVAYNIPFYENPEWAVKLMEKAGGKGPTKEEAERAIRQWYPQYFNPDLHERSKHNESKPELQVGDEIALKDVRPTDFKVTALQPGGSFLIEGSNGRLYRLTKQRLFKSLAQVKRNGEIIWMVK